MPEGCGVRKKRVPGEAGAAARSAGRDAQAAAVTERTESRRIICEYAQQPRAAESSVAQPA